VELRVYDRLFKVETPQGIEDLNEESLKIVKDALIEPSVITQIAQKSEVRFQFEREGYFYADPVDYSEKNPVFNKIVSLKDSWAKKKDKEISSKKPAPKKVQVEGSEEPMSKEEQKLYDRYTKELKLNEAVSNILARDKNLSTFFEEALSVYESAINIANIVANEVSREFKQNGFKSVKFTATDVANLIKMVDEGTISTKIAKEVFEMMSKSGKEPAKIVEEKGLKQISEPSVILPIIDEIIKTNQENVQKYRDGNKKLFGFFVGQVLKATNGKANPKVVNELVAKSLS